MRATGRPASGGAVTKRPAGQYKGPGTDRGGRDAEWTRSSTRSGPPRGSGPVRQAAGGAGRRGDDRWSGGAGGLDPEARRAVARGRSVRNSPGTGERVPDEAAKRFRGSVARKGARLVTSDDGRTRRDADRVRVRPEKWEPEVWVEDEVKAEVKAEDDLSGTASAPVRARSVRTVPAEVQHELQDAVGAAKVANIERRLAEAVKAYERDRYQDALTTLRPVARVAPMSPTVRELHGLTLYRLGKWVAAIRELEAFHALTGSFDQHPVLADCYRATGRSRKVEEVFEELRKSSPAPDVLTEGRIVMAAARADKGDLAGAIELLERARTKVRSPQLHHLRLWYALADLYERAGEMPRARALFHSVLDQDPSLFDTADRVAALA